MDFTAAIYATYSAPRLVLYRFDKNNRFFFLGMLSIFMFSISHTNLPEYAILKKLISLSRINTGGSLRSSCGTVRA